MVHLQLAIGNFLLHALGATLQQSILLAATHLYRAEDQLGPYQLSQLATNE